VGIYNHSKDNGIQPAQHHSRIEITAQFLHEVIGMQRAILVAFTLFAVGSFAQQTPSSRSADTAAQVQVKQSDSNNSVTSGDQIVSDSKWHLHLGTISFGAGYDHFSSPHYPYAFYPYSSYYPSLLWDPYWGYLYPAAYFNYNDGKGEVRLAAPKQADVYLDNAYAGKAEKLKSIWLKPGAYDLSVSDADRASFHRRIYVFSGKSLKIAAKLEPPKSEEKP
jgi:hypothetical protein